MRNYVMWDIDFRDKINVDELNKKIHDFINLNPNLDLVLQVPSTQGATSLFVQKLDPRVKIRIAGAYDAERLEAYKNVRFRQGADCKEAFIDSVIYTRNETIRILREIEKIESGLMDNWSNLQKAIYIYDVLKSTMVYDEKYETKRWSEIRSLRGLITKQTVCAGYALIYKEILERNGITCKFVVGSAHAWNVLIIDDQYISADVTSDHYNLRRGIIGTHQAFGQKDSDFNRKRKTEPQETFKKYIGNLTELDRRFVEELSHNSSIERTHERESYRFVRDNNTSFFLAQVGKKVVRDNGFNIIYHKYYYRGINRDGTYQTPKILYSYFDLTSYIEKVRFNEITGNPKKHSIVNVLFSEENIRDSEMKGTSFIGHESIGDRSVRSVNEIHKRDADIRRIGYPSRVFTRENGEKVIVEELSGPTIVKTQNKQKTVYSYRIYEINNMQLKSTRIYTEMNLLKSNNQNIGNVLLKSSRINQRKVSSGGYIGYLSESGSIKVNPDLINYYSANKRIDNPALNPMRPMMLPEFEELEYLARNYEIMFDQSKGQIVVRNLKTKAILNDKRLERKALLANIWLVSAGLKSTKIEARKGVKDAFSLEKKAIYASICEAIVFKLQTKGELDTTAIYKKFRNYPIAEKIVLNLFKNEFQANSLSDIFLMIARPHRTTGVRPIVLNNKEHAEQLIRQRGL